MQSVMGCSFRTYRNVPGVRTWILHIHVPDSVNFLLKSQKLVKNGCCCCLNDERGAEQPSFPSRAPACRYQAKETYENPVDLLLEPQWTIWDYSDIPAVLKRAMKKLRDTLESGLQLQEVNVILDPDTANASCLNVSEDQKSVQGLKLLKANYNDSKRKRFVHHPCVLGCQMFSAGRHFWEVIVGGRAEWGVGVANQPVNITNADQQIMRWEFWKCGGQYMAKSPSECSNLVVTKRPKRIRVSLNNEEGQVSFFDARTLTLLHTFSDASLVGETLRPCFYLGEGTYMTLPSKKGTSISKTLEKSLFAKQGSLQAFKAEIP